MITSKSLILAHATAIAIFSFLCKGAMSFRDITDALAFYGVYHRNPINQLIHFFGVPCIVWSILLFLSHLIVPFPILNSMVVKVPYAPRHNLTYATVVTIGYVLFYIYLDTFGGALYAPFAYLQYISVVSLQAKDQMKANKINERIEKKYDGVPRTKNHSSSSWMGTGGMLKLAFIVNFLGWYVQIHPGHGVFEGAKPAVMQSIGGALTSAPLFAYYEGLWFVGWNKDLQVQTKAMVDIYTKELCDGGAVMTACTNYN